MLSTEDVAGYLGVGQATVWRWCREGSLPCMKIGKHWRIRREAFEEFLEQRERPATFAGQLRSFLQVPDNIVGVAQNFELLRRLDCAFFRVGEAQAELLVKFYDEEAESADELRADLEGSGLKVGRLEEEGCFRFVAESGPPIGRTDELRRIVDEEADGGRTTVWASFDWAKQVDLEEAIRQQEELAELVEERPLVVKTAVLEAVMDNWSPSTQRQLQAQYSGMIWLSEAGLRLSRLTPIPPP